MKDQRLLKVLEKEPTTFISKAVYIQELLERIRAVLRRSQKSKVSAKASPGSFGKWQLVP